MYCKRRGTVFYSYIITSFVLLFKILFVQSLRKKLNIFFLLYTYNIFIYPFEKTVVDFIFLDFRKTVSSKYSSCVFFTLLLFFFIFNFYYHNISQPTQKATRTN